MDNKQAISRHRLSKIRELSARCKKSDAGKSGSDNVTEFASRDEYGRYREDGGNGAGIGAVGAATAVGGGLYLRGRLSGAVPPSSVGEGFRRGARFLKQDASNAKSGLKRRVSEVGAAGRQSFKGARSEMRNIRTSEVAKSGYPQGMDLVKRNTKIGRKYLRSFLTRASKAIR